jgi:hypothetical protein
MRSNLASSGNGHVAFGRSALVVPWICAAAGLAWGQSADDFRFEVMDAEGYPGETVTTSVFFNNAGSHDVRGWQIALRCQGCQNVNLVSAESGAVAVPADFNAIKFDSAGGWIKQGVVIDTDGDGVLHPGLQYETLKLSFKLGENPAEGCSCPVQFVRFPDTILDPPVWTGVDAVKDDGSSVAIRDLNNLVAGTISCKPTSICCPAGTPPAECKFPAEEGFDYMQTTSPSFRFSLYGIGTYDVDEDGLSGPTVVYRSAPMEKDGCRYLQTRIVQLTLEGMIAGTDWRVVVTDNSFYIGNSNLASRGEVKPVDCGNTDFDFPAYSFFDLYFKIFVYYKPDSTEPDLILFNKTPKFQRNQVCKLPPVQEGSYEPPEAIDLYDAKDKDLDALPVGQILGAHNPDLVVPPPPPERPPFIRGDANVDGLIDISDGIMILKHLFLGEPSAVPCIVALDVNATAWELDPSEISKKMCVNIGDGIYLLQHLFMFGPPPPDPYPFCGRTDPNWDKDMLLGCGEYSEESCLLSVRIRTSN